LRKNVELMLATEKVIFPELSLCTDNAAMIAYLGELYLSRGIKSNIDFPIQPNLKLA